MTEPPDRGVRDGGPVEAGDVEPLPPGVATRAEPPPQGGSRRPSAVVAGFAAVALLALIMWVVRPGLPDSETPPADEPAPPVVTATTQSPVTTTGALAEAQALVQALEPGFINPCHVLRAAVDAAGVSVSIPAGSRHGEVDPGFRMCHASPDGEGWSTPHSGLYTGSVSSDDQAGELIKRLFVVDRSAPWTSTGDSTWSYDGSQNIPQSSGKFAAVAILQAPYLFVVTDDNPARAMEVAQAAAVELASWEPDPNYVCGLFATAQGGSGLVADSVDVTAFEQYPTGAASLSEVCEAEQGSELSQLHLFWRVPATTAEDAAQLLATADDLPLLANTEWAATTPPERSGESFPPRTWIGDTTDAAGDDFYAVAISTDPHFFIVTHADRDQAMEIAFGVLDEVIERIPPTTPPTTETATTNAPGATGDDLSGAWQATPLAISDAALQEMDEECLGYLTDRMGQGLSLVVADARGENRVDLIYAGADGHWGACEATVGMSGNSESTLTWTTTPGQHIEVVPLEPTELRVDILSGIERGDLGEGSLIQGQAGTGIHQVVAHVTGSPPVVASLEGGWFSLWFPFDRYSDYRLVGLDAAGNEVAQLQSPVVPS